MKIQTMVLQEQLEELINMKHFLFIIFFVFNFSIFSQEAIEKKLDTIRQQGYLIVGTDELGNLSDISPKFLFIPMRDMENNISSSYTKNNFPNFNDLFIPTPYVLSDSELSDMNFYIRKFINPKIKINLNQNEISISDFIKNCSRIYKFRDSLSQPIKVFKIVYIDGLWMKIKTLKKQALPISASYNETRLNKKDNKCLEYYFLIETKAISYDIQFTDNSIEIIIPKD